MVRAAIERLYKGLCSVKVKVSSVNEETGETVFTEKAVLTEQPCRLSFQSRNSAAKDDGYNTVSQSVVLFIAPEVEIPSGSKITVTQNGKTTDYCRSGESAVYTSHRFQNRVFSDHADVRRTIFYIGRYIRSLR